RLLLLEDKSGFPRKAAMNQLKAYEREVFAVMFLDNQHHLISFEELFFGTIDSASVYPREVVKAALKTNAAAVIFAHNHPSGDATPSQADKRITQRLKDALALVDIRVLDHIVIGDSAVSFAERGLL
ncbi:DNA repair protein RadC, partial [Vibrio sp. FF112]|uniref:RadC family protein n=1 Tax=Vibrio sp. FF112 TaxID=3230008 RepID=UPI00352BF5C7